MHRIKGLEFDHIILASANDDELPPQYLIEKQDNKTTKERALIYVAITRARKSAFITSYDKLTSFIK